MVDDEKMVKELTLEVEKLKNQLKRIKLKKKYGLVWEEEKEPENVVIECQYKLPILTEVKENEIVKSKGGPINVIIEGDNYHALSVLNYTHKKAIDVIYIDPPYNTGSEDWKYNNNFVDKNDAYRHSKWLNMMAKRLTLAKNLLKDDGVLICTIDENEFYRLGCLLEELFYDYEIHCITIVHNPRGVQGNNFSYTHEYAYFLFKDGLKVIGPRKLKEEEINGSNLRNWGGESLRSDALNCFYPILVKDMKIVGFGDVPPDSFHPKKQTEEKNGTYYVWPIDVKGTEHKWRYARQSVAAIKNILEVKKADERIEIEIKKNYGVVKTVWQDSKYDAGIYGTQLVHALVPKSHFDFPKSVYNVLDCISPILSTRKDAIVLDFFAGSGTTGHATLILNKNDNGTRRFILCTNNENNIAEEICYPRIKKVIEGQPDYSDITGIPANLKYFKTEFVNVDHIYQISDEKRVEITYQAGKMIALRENTLNEVEKNDWWQTFSNGRNLTAIYFKEDKSKLNKLVKHLSEIKADVALYIFSWGKNEYTNEFTEYENIRVEDIPEPIIEVYRELNKLA